MTDQEWKELCQQANGRTIIWEHKWVRGIVPLKVLVLADSIKGISIKPIASKERVAKLRTKHGLRTYAENFKTVSKPTYCLFHFTPKKLNFYSPFAIDSLKELATKKRVSISKNFYGWGAPVCPF